MKQKSLAMMDAILGAISESREWIEIQNTSPVIVEAFASMDAAVEKARAYIPADLCDELEIAQSAAIGAIGEAGILYGIHVGDVIHQTTADPIPLAHFIQSGRKEG